MKRFFGCFALIAGALGLCASGVATGNPTGPTVVRGNATMPLPVINTPAAILSWQGYRIAPNEMGNFIQQSGSSAVLNQNRNAGVDPAAILGSLQSNGRVFLINPNGIAFPANATLSASGVIAPGASFVMSDPKSPGLSVEVKAPADRSVNVRQVVDSIGQRDVTSALTFGSGARAATMAVRDEAGRIMLKAAP